MTQQAKTDIKASLWPAITAIIAIASIVTMAGRGLQKIETLDKDVSEVKGRVSALEVNAAKTAETQACIATDIRWIRVSIENLIKRHEGDK